MAKKAKSNKIEVKVIKGNALGVTPTPVDMMAHNKLVKIGSTKEVAVRPALLISAVDYPVAIAYGDQTIRLTPRGREKVADVDKLDVDTFPKGIHLKKLTKKK